MNLGRSGDAARGALETGGRRQHVPEDASRGTSLDVEALVSWFHDFADRHMRELGRLGSDQAEGHEENLELKREHTLKVLEEARAITAAHPPQETGLVPLCHAAALFHDIGRFPQYLRHQTFDDRRSVNHARLGAGILREHDPLEGLSRRDKALVLGAVTLHNRRNLPAHIPPRLAWMTHVVRDADKLDIMRVMLGHFAGPYNPVVLLHLTPHPDKYSQSIVEQVLSWELADYGEMVWVNDFKLLLLSWLSDLHFSASRRAFFDRGHVEALFASLPRDETMALLRRRILQRYGADGAVLPLQSRARPKDGRT